MRPSTKLVIAFTAAVLTLSACGSDGDDVATSGNDGGDPKLTITAPEDGASVQLPFTLEWDSTSELGEPDTGKDHVHVFVDGNSEDYTVVGGTEFELEDLPPGEHKVEISLQRADHSPVGPKSAITVTVGGGSSPSSDESDESGGDGGY